MICSETNDTKTGNSSISDSESPSFPYCKRKMRKYCSYDNKHYDDFNSTILYPTESLLPLNYSDINLKDSTLCDKLMNDRGVKRSNEIYPDAHRLPSTANSSKLDMMIRREENRSTYELLKQSEIIHENLLHSINESVVDSDTDYDADYDNDGDFKNGEDQYQQGYNENFVNDASRSYQRSIASFANNYQKDQNNAFYTADDRIQWELQQLEEMEEMEDLETLDLMEQLKEMNI